MLSRRALITSTTAVLTGSGFPRTGRAAAFPERPVRVFVTTAPGGTSDIVSRLTSNEASERLGRPFIVENRPGGGGIVATMTAKNEPADGYTLLAVSRAQVLFNVFYNNLDFDFTRDFEPVARLASGGLVLLVHPSVPAKTLSEFVAWAKADPGKLNYGTPGKGTDPHLTAELFKMQTGIKMTHIAYRGGAAALTDLLSGNINVFFSNLPVAEYIAAGKLRALGVTTARRQSAYPDLPAIADVVPNFDVDTWHAFVARQNSPAEAIDILNQAYAASLADPKVIAGLAPLGLVPAPMTPAALGAFFTAEAVKWSAVVKAQNIKLD